MDKKTLQSILSKPFELNDWQILLTEVFSVKSFLQKPAVIPLASNKKAESAFELGSFSTGKSGEIDHLFPVQIDHLKL